MNHTSTIPSIYQSYMNHKSTTTTIYQSYISHISTKTIYKSYTNHISTIPTIYQPYINHVSTITTIYQAYINHISTIPSIYQPYINHFPWLMFNYVSFYHNDLMVSLGCQVLDVNLQQLLGPFPGVQTPRVLGRRPSIERCHLCTAHDDKQLISN